MMALKGKVFGLCVVKDTESGSRYVVANETRNYGIVLVCTKLENVCMDLEKMRKRKMAL